MASGIPGSVAGMWEAHRKYGKLQWKDLVLPAIQLARTGFKISQRQANEFESHKERFVKLNPAGAAIIKTTVWRAGDLFIQEELAKTLERIAIEGRDGFYKGKTADLIVAEMDKGKALLIIKIYWIIRHFGVPQFPQIIGATKLFPCHHLRVGEHLF